MDIPFEVFVMFVGTAIAMSIIGIWKKTPLLLFIGGSLIAFWVIMTDNIIMGSIPQSSSVSGLTTTYVMVDNLYPFTEYPKILFALLGSMMGIAGALVWKTIET